MNIWYNIARICVKTRGFWWAYSTLSSQRLYIWWMRERYDARQGILTIRNILVGAGRRRRGMNKKKNTHTQKLSECADIDDNDSARQNMQISTCIVFHSIIHEFTHWMWRMADPSGSTIAVLRKWFALSSSQRTDEKKFAGCCFLSHS